MARISQHIQRCSAQCLINPDLIPSRRTDIKNVAVRDAPGLETQYFLQGQRLSAELDMIGDPLSHFAFFILDRIDMPCFCCCSQVNADLLDF